MFHGSWALYSFCYWVAPFFRSKKKKTAVSSCMQKTNNIMLAGTKKMSFIHFNSSEWFFRQLCHVWMVQLYEWCLLGTSHGNYFPWMSIFHLDDVFCLCMNWQLEELKRFPCCHLWARCPWGHRSFSLPVISQMMRMWTSRAQKQVNKLGRSNYYSKPFVVFPK